MTFREMVEEVPRLTVEERRALLKIIHKSLEHEQRKAEPSGEGEQKTRSLLELEGLGAEVWQGIDAQEYVTALRREWDHRP